MKVKGRFILASVERRPGFQDPTKYNNVVLLLDGGDTLQMYVNDAIYNEVVNKPLFKPYDCELNFKPFSQKVTYCMDLLSVSECK